jgi:hypothetical protein
MTQERESPEKFAARVIALHGGREAFLAHSNAQINELNLRWNQDAVLIGRILRAHLFVEHYLTKYLAARNPNVGDIEEARLSFFQKVALLGQNDPRVSYLVPGIRRLNAVRNRLAHTLSALVSLEDRDCFLAVELFSALRNALALPSVPSSEPIDTLEAFAQHAGMALQSAADPNSSYWVQAAMPARQG